MVPVKRAMLCVGMNYSHVAVSVCIQNYATSYTRSIKDNLTKQQQEDALGFKGSHDALRGSWV
jgi:hypothetical protein